MIAEEDVLGDPIVVQLKQPDSFEVEVNAYTISSTGYMTGINFDALLGYPVDAEFTQSLAFLDSAGQPVMIADAAPVSTQNVIDYRVCADRVDITRTHKAGSVSYRDKQVTVGVRRWSRCGVLGRKPSASSPSHLLRSPTIRRYYLPCKLITVCAAKLH